MCSWTQCSDVVLPVRRSTRDCEAILKIIYGKRMRNATGFTSRVFASEPLRFGRRSAPDADVVISEIEVRRAFRTRGIWHRTQPLTASAGQTAGV